MARRAASVVLALALGCTVVGCVNVASPANTATPTSIPLESSPPATSRLTSGPAIPTDGAAPTAATVPTNSVPTPPEIESSLTPTSNRGSIVYIEAGDVWIAAPDGSGARQLTTDGVQAGYHDPAQAPDGTVFALRGPGTLVALDRATGAAKAAPVTLPTLENGAEQLKISPDGVHMAYTTTGFGKTVEPRFGTPNGAFIYGGTDVATLDGASVPDAAVAGGIFPTWLNASTLVMSDGTKLYTDSVGGSPSAWLDLSNGCLTDVGCPAGESPAANLTEPSIGANGKLISAVVQPYYGDGGRQVGRLDSPPPALPSSTCVLPGQQNYSDPGTFAPDGSGFAYDDTTFDPNTLDSTVGQGIFVVRLDLSSQDCGASTASLVLPGGAQPDWGPLAP